MPTPWGHRGGGGDTREGGLGGPGCHPRVTRVTQGPPVGHRVGGDNPLGTSWWPRGHAGRKVWGVLDVTAQTRTSVPPLGDTAVAMGTLDTHPGVPTRGTASTVAHAQRGDTPSWPGPHSVTSLSPLPAPGVSLCPLQGSRGVFGDTGTRPAPPWDPSPALLSLSSALSPPGGDCHRGGGRAGVPLRCVGGCPWGFPASQSFWEPSRPR